MCVTEAVNNEFSLWGGGDTEVTWLTYAWQTSHVNIIFYSLSAL